MNLSCGGESMVCSARTLLDIRSLSIPLARGRRAYCSKASANIGASITLPTSIQVSWGPLTFKAQFSRFPKMTSSVALFPRLRHLHLMTKIAGRVFKRVFLARLLIFHLFIEAMKANTSSDDGFTEGNVRDYRRKWLYFQLQPSFFVEICDPFRDLTHKLSAYLDSELHHLTIDVLEHVRNTLKSCTTSASSSGYTPLYWIIDEARFAAKEHTDAFRSKDMEPRPVLRPLVQTFTALTSGLDVIILAGTGLSQSDVDDTMASGVMKESSYRQCYDTGAFDGWDGKNGMSSWVKMFIPDWILEEAERKNLEERMGYWLKGRFASAFYLYDNILITIFPLPFVVFLFI